MYFISQSDLVVTATAAATVVVILLFVILVALTIVLLVLAHGRLAGEPEHSRGDDLLLDDVTDLAC